MSAVCELSVDEEGLLGVIMGLVNVVLLPSATGEQENSQKVGS